MEENVNREESHPCIYTDKIKYQNYRFVNGCNFKWNYESDCLQYDEEYFPYDKEIVFLDDVDGNGSRNSLLVYGVCLHHSAYFCSIFCIVFNRRTQCRDLGRYLG